MARLAKRYGIPDVALAKIRPHRDRVGLTMTAAG